MENKITYSKRNDTNNKLTQLSKRLAVLFVYIYFALRLGHGQKSKVIRLFRLFRFLFAT